jgi:hypothetical protein
MNLMDIHRFKLMNLPMFLVVEVTGLDTDHIPPIPACVGIITEAQLRHRYNASGEKELDLSRDKPITMGLPA